MSVQIWRSISKEVKFEDIKKLMDIKLFKFVMANKNHDLRHFMPPARWNQDLRHDTLAQVCVYKNFNYRQFFNPMLRQYSL